MFKYLFIHSEKRYLFSQFTMLKDIIILYILSFYIYALMSIYCDTWLKNERFQGLFLIIY